MYHHKQGNERNHHHHHHHHHHLKALQYENGRNNQLGIFTHHKIPGSA
jgi:hypothetical protein